MRPCSCPCCSSCSRSAAGAGRRRRRSHGPGRDRGLPASQRRRLRDLLGARHGPRARRCHRRRAPRCPRRQAACFSAAVGTSWSAVAAFTIEEPREGLEAWMATVFGALYVSLLSFIIRLGQTAPAVPSDAPLNALGAERGWILLLVFAVWSYDTGAYLVGKNFGRTQIPDPHLAVEDDRGPRWRCRRRHGRDVRSCCGASASTRSTRSCSGRSTALAAQAGDLAESVHQAGGRRQGLGHADPRPRRDPRPGRFVRLRRACRHPVCPRPRRLRWPAPRSQAPRGSRFSARPVRSGARRSTSSAEQPRRLRSRRARRRRQRRPCWPSRRPGSGQQPSRGGRNRPRRA